jgi:hypothetical protein
VFRRTKLWVAVILIVIVALLLFARTYYVQRHFRGSLVWNDNVAYIFVGETAEGWALSYLGSGVAWTRALFPFGVTAPTDRHGSTIVLRLTAKSVQSFSFDHFAFDDVDPFQGTLYVPNMVADGRMMKWCGNHFEPATAAEFQKLIEYAARLPKGPPLSINFDNVQGWSRRIVVGEFAYQMKDGRLSPVEKDSQVTIEAGGPRTRFEALRVAAASWESC